MHCVRLKITSRLLAAGDSDVVAGQQTPLPLILTCPKIYFCLQMYFLLNIQNTWLKNTPLKIFKGKIKILSAPIFSVGKLQLSVENFQLPAF